MAKTNKEAKPNVLDRNYCIDKIREIEDFLPGNYSDLVNALAAKDGLPPFSEVRIRNVRTFKTYDKTIADLLYMIGSTFKTLLSKPKKNSP
jgi:hypothetical protein